MNNYDKKKSIHFIEQFEFDFFTILEQINSSKERYFIEYQQIKLFPSLINGN